MTDTPEQDSDPTPQQDAQPTTAAATPTTAVPAPVRGLDPRISLATAVHAGPGVYALLLGSGISSSAAIPTGWAIVTDLARRAATAASLQEPGEDFDPEAWWKEHGDGSDLGYSALLNALSNTPAGRDQVLRGYFEATDDDREEGRKLPTVAHHAIAELVASGHIRVILTTNFDRLLESALEQRGVQPQVIHRPDQIASMTPLTHAAVTIVKLHGDYSDLDKRNTVDELSEYPAAQDELLRRILDEYGLIVCGWSADWDVALVSALETTKQRRYPLFWSSYGQPTPSAAALIAQTQGTLIVGAGADELFQGLRDRLTALDRLAAPPLTRELAVARLKRNLPDPVRRIDTHDLVTEDLKRVEVLLADNDRYPLYLPNLPDAEFVQRLDDCLRNYRSDMDTLLHLLATGAYHGTSEQYGLWSNVIRRLLAVKHRATENGVTQPALTGLRHYPGLLAVTAMLSAASLAGTEQGLVGPLLKTPTYREPTRAAEDPASYLVHAYRVFPNDAANSLPRWKPETNGRYYFAASHLLRQDVDDILTTFETSPARRTWAVDKAEYLTAVAQQASSDHAALGEFTLGNRFSYGQDALPVAIEVRTALARSAAPLVADLFDGDAAAAEAAMDKLDGYIKESAERR